MNNTSILNQSKTQRVRFRLDQTKIIYFNTFINEQRIYYIAQCESKKVYIGRADQATFDLCFQTKIKQKIKCITVMNSLNKQQVTNHLLWIGTGKGTVIGVDYQSQKIYNGEEQTENHNYRIDAIDGKPIIGVLALWQNNEQKQDRIVITFTAQGVVREFINEKLSKTVKLPSNITKFCINRTPNNLQDIWCAFFLKDVCIPYIFDMKRVLMFFTPETSIQQKLSAYLECIGYEDDQFIKQIEPTSMAISNNRAILILNYNDTVCIYEISKKKKQHFYAQLQFQFSTLNKQKIISLDIINSSIAYQTQSQILTYDIETRNKISKSMTIKGSTVYNTLLWAKVDELLLYGMVDNSDKTKMMFHKFQKIVNKEDSLKK